MFHAVICTDNDQMDLLKSDEAGINTGAEPKGGTDAAASTGRPRTGVGAAGVATAVAVGTEEAGTGIGTEQEAAQMLP